MGVSGLEKVDCVKLFSVREKQVVMEHDSPALGATTNIAERDSMYEFFHSENEARNYVRKLQVDYQARNESLQLKEDGNLHGNVKHPYSHSFEISHKIAGMTIPVSELPENIEALLLNPERKNTCNFKKAPEEEVGFFGIPRKYDFELF